MSQAKAPIYDVLFYESVEGIQVVRDAYELLKPANESFRRIVRALSKKEESESNGKASMPLIKEDTPKDRRKAVWLLLNESEGLRPDEKVALDSLIDFIPKERKFFITTSPYDKLGYIPRNFEELKDAYATFMEEFQAVSGGIGDPGKIGMFVFNAHKGNGELDKIMQSIETDFPALKNCYWLLCRNEEGALSPTIVDRMREDQLNRRGLVYNLESARTIAEEIVRRVILYPAYQKPAERKTSKTTRFETAIFSPPLDQNIIDEYSKRLRQDVKVGGLNPEAINVVLAVFRINEKCSEKDPRLLRLRSELEKEYRRIEGEKS